MNGRPGSQGPPDDKDALFRFCLVVLSGAMSLTWIGMQLGALLAHGHAAHIPLSAALAFLFHLKADAADPRLAWPSPANEALPGPDLYWFSTVAAGLGMLGAGAGLWWVFHRPNESLDRRKRLGVRTQGRLARRADLAPLLVSRPTPGRLTLGRFGHSLIATEDPRPARRRINMGRAGVALVGPTRSGKTTTAIAGILDWEGPGVFVSLKADLLAVTEEERARLGPVQVFDPAGVIARPSAVWDPLAQTGSISGTVRMARALREAAPRPASADAHAFWDQMAESLIAGLLLLGALCQRSFADVVRWVVTTDMPTDRAPGQVAPLIRALKADADPVRKAAGVFVADAVEGLWRNDQRTVSSVYATARTLVWAFVDPTVASATGRNHPDRIDARELLGGTGSLYVCLPLADQDRLRPVVGGVLAEIVGAAYERHLATGKALDPPLLLVIDEAATLRPEQLPSWAATLAGIGVQLVTVWQSVTQIEAAYGPQAQAILTNHLTKLFFSGMSDTAGLNYVSALAGDEHLPARLSRGPRRDPWDEDPVTTLPVAPPAVLRQMRRGDALLIHGSLPPAHIRPLGPRRPSRLAPLAKWAWSGLTGPGASRAAASLRAALLRSGSRSAYGRPLTPPPRRHGDR